MDLDGPKFHCSINNRAHFACRGRQLSTKKWAVSTTVLQVESIAFIADVRRTVEAHIVWAIAFVGEVEGKEKSLLPI